MDKVKGSLFFLSVLFSLMFLFSGVFAFDVTELELNGKKMSDSTQNYIRQLTRDDYVSINVDVVSNIDAKNVVIETAISGLEHDSENARDISDVFDMEQGVTYTKELKIYVPKRMQSENTYRLRVRVEDQNSAGRYIDYFIYVSSLTRSVEISDVVLSPENEVVSGQALLVENLVKNYGARKESNVKVTAYITELGLSASKYIDTIESDEAVFAEPIFLKIPSCAENGLYNVNVEVEYNDGDSVATKEVPVRIVKSERCVSLSEKSTDVSDKISIVYETPKVSVPVKVETKTLGIFTRDLLQYSLFGMILVIVLLLILIVVRQKKKDSMQDEDLLRELERN